MFKIHLRLMFCAVFFIALTGCNQKPENPEQKNDLSKDVEEMRAELRLVLKEVIDLSKKVDSLAVVNKPGSNAARVATQSVVMPAAERMNGAADAEYAIVEFMDYQCPYCVRHAKQVLPEIKQRYIDSGKLKYGIRDFPLDFHSKAEGAAIAANCAGKQGKYWAMHDDLIVNSRKLNDQLYTELAEKHKLENDVFVACQNDPDMKKAVETDLAYGAQVGTRGTPKFFIGKVAGDSIVNVVELSGARPFESFDRAIQQVMAAN